MHSTVHIYIQGYCQGRKIQVSSGSTTEGSFEQSGSETRGCCTPRPSAGSLISSPSTCAFALASQQHGSRWLLTLQGVLSTPWQPNRLSERHIDSQLCRALADPGLDEILVPARAAARLIETRTCRLCWRGHLQCTWQSSRAPVWREVSPLAPTLLFSRCLSLPAKCSYMLAWLRP